MTCQPDAELAEIDLQLGDVVLVRRKTDTGWWSGTVQNKPEPRPRKLFRVATRPLLRVMMQLDGFRPPVFSPGCAPSASRSLEGRC